MFITKGIKENKAMHSVEWFYQVELPVHFMAEHPLGSVVLNENTRFINLGTAHDTTAFSVESILDGGTQLEETLFQMQQKIITYIGDLCNGLRGHLWKQQLTELSKATGLEVHVSHFPSGASKWNKVGHRMFCYISKNWQGQLLVDIETVISLISSTTTKTRLKIKCISDYNKYELGKSVTAEEFFALPIQYLNDLGKRDYVIKAAAQ